MKKTLKIITLAGLFAANTHTIEIGGTAATAHIDHPVCREN